jgi:ribosome-associated protein
VRERVVPVHGGCIELGKFLKLVRVVRSGGDAKHLVQAGRVRVNGRVEMRRGVKLRAGDVVEVGGQRWVVGGG